MHPSAEMGADVPEAEQLALVGSEAAPETSGRPEVDLRERLTPELVIALTGPIGSGCTFTANRLQEIFEQDYGYIPHYVRVSNFITEVAGEVDVKGLGQLKGFERVRGYQKAGNEYRKRHGAGVLAKHVVDEIHRHRESKGGFRETAGAATPIAEPRRVVHIVDSLKNPEEINILSQVYGKALWLFGVFAPHSKRRKRLGDAGFKAPEIETVVEIDENEPFAHGQKVRKTVEAADFFIRNESDQKGAMDTQLRRFINLILDVGVVTPTKHERAMAVASSTAVSSACLSRQVGAAVYSKTDELLGVGANDVPRYGGGLYSSDQANDSRCAFWRTGDCLNDREKDKLTEQIVLDIKDLIVPGKQDQVLALVRKSRVSDLIEFSRAVHAEMEAIVSVARSGRTGIIGGRLYTTTFPCHNCARHIVASGIGEVYYIEPYPKSLALSLHDDSISDLSSDKGSKCVFLQFEGVAPKNMEKLFRIKSDRKRDGRVVAQRAKEAMPVADTPLDAIHEREDIVIATLPALLGRDGVQAGSNDGRRRPDVNVVSDTGETVP